MIGLLDLSCSLGDAFSYVEQEYLDLIQLPLENSLKMLQPEQVSDLADACKKKGKVLAFHAPSADIVLGSRNDGIREESIRQVRESIKVVGPYAEFITIHTGFTPRFAGSGSLERCISALRDLAGTASDYNTILSIENVHEETIDQILDYIRLALPHPLKVTFDVAHAYLYSNIHVETAFRVLTDHLVDIHLSYPQGNHDSHLPLPVDWDVLKCVVSTAKNCNLKASLTVESLNSSRGLQSAKLVSELFHANNS